MSNTTSDCTSVAGIEFCRNSPSVFIEYSVVNIVGTSIIPVPLAGPLAGVATLLFGLWIGLIVNVVTSTVGAWLGLLCVRHACRPCCMRMLGRYEKRWQALDAALTAQGWQIALLIRIAPISPMVMTNILLSLRDSSAHLLVDLLRGHLPGESPVCLRCPSGPRPLGGIPAEDR